MEVLLDRIDGIIFAIPIGIIIFNFFNMKKIAIFGATGSIGNTLIKYN